MEFFGVPLLRLPVISFPVGNARKSGVLFPSLGSTSSSGVQLSVPYYFNIAPQPGHDGDADLVHAGAASISNAEYRFLTLEHDAARSRQLAAQ